jgi:autotransporter-associated beta strand protein
MVLKTLLAAALISATRSACAASLLWSGDVGDEWSTAPSELSFTTPWINNSPRSAPNAAIFDLPTPATVSVTGSIDVGAITFVSAGWNIANAGGVLAFGGTGSLIVTASSGSNTLGAAIVNGYTFGSAGGVTSLTKTGAGTLVLAGVNTYTGSTVASAGILQLGTNNAIGVNGTFTVNGASSAADAATLDLHGFNQSLAAIAGGGGVFRGIITSDAGSSVLSLTGAANSQFDGILRDGGGILALSKTGSGTLTLTSQNTFSGATTIDNGTIVIAATGSLLNTAITINGNGKLTVFNPAGASPSASVSANAVTLNGGSLSFAADVSLAGFLSNVSSGGNLLIDTGTTDFTAGGANAINFAALPGTGLRLGSSGSGRIGAAVILTPDTVTHTLRFGGGPGALTVNAAITDIGGTPTHLDFDGASTTVLAGNNTYTGTTMIGTLANVMVSSSTGLGSTSSGTTVGVGGTLTLNAASAEPLQVNGGRVIINAAYSGTATVNDGALRIGAAGSATNAVVLAGGILSLGRDVNPATLLAPTSTGGVIAPGTGGTFTAGGTNAINFNALPGGSALRLGVDTNSTTLASAVALTPDSTTHTLRFGGGTNNTLTLFYSGVIADVGGVPTNLDITGGTLTSLGGTNTYSGITTLNGSLTITNAASLGAGTGVDANGTIVNAGGSLTATSFTLANEKITLNGGAINVVTNGPVLVNAPSSLKGTYKGIISGSGDLTFNGTSTLTAANDYTGATITNAGTITVMTAGTLGSSAVGTTINSGGTLTLNVVSAEPVSVAGGTLNINANTTGPISLATGTVNIGAVNVSAVTLSGGTLNLNVASAQNITLNGGLANIKAAATGSIDLSAGTLKIVSGGSLAANALTLDGGTLSLGVDVNLPTLAATSTGGIIAIDMSNYTAGGTNAINFSAFPAPSNLRLGSNAAGSIAATTILTPDNSTHTLRFGGGTSTLTYNGAIADVAADPTHLNFSGAGTTILGGDSTFTGITTINSAVQVSHANALGAGTGIDADGTVINAGGSLTTNGVTLLNEKITLNGGFANILSNGPVEVLAPSTVAGVFHGVISGSADLAVSSLGAGFTHDSPYSGQITLTSGNFTITSGGSLLNVTHFEVDGATFTVFRGAGGDSALNSASPGTVYLNGGTFGIGADFDPVPFLNNASTGGGFAVNVLDFTAGGTNLLDMNSIPGGANLRIGSNGTGSIAASVSLIPDAASHTIRFGTSSTTSSLGVFATLADAGGVPTSLDIGPGNAIQLEAANTYSGVTVVRGPLTLNNDLALGAGTGTDADGTRVALGGVLTTLPGITLSNEEITLLGGTINVVSNGPVDVASSGTVTGTFNGAFSGPGSLTVAGLTSFSGNSNYSGATTLVSGSTLTVNHVNALGDPLAATTIPTGAGVNVQAASPETFNVTGGTLHINAAATGIANISSGTLNLNVVAPETLNITGGTVNVNSAGGGTANISGGTLNINNASAENVNFSGGTLTLSAPLAGTLAVSGGTTSLTIAGTGPLAVSGGTLNINVATAQTLTVTGGTANIAFADATPITQKGGVVILTDVAHPLTGAYHLNGGLLAMGNTLGTATITQTLQVSGTPIVENSRDRTLILSGGISGTGYLQVAPNLGGGNPGIIQLSGPLNFDGVFLTGNTNGAGEGTTKLADVNTSGTLHLGGTVLISGTLNHTGDANFTGAVTLSGPAANVSGTVFNSGTLTINNTATFNHLALAAGSLLGNGTINITDAQLEFQSGNVNFPGSFGSVTSIAKTGDGRVEVTALPASFSGPINVQSGELRLISGINGNANPITLAPSNAVLSLIDGAYNTPLFLNNATGVRNTGAVFAGLGNLGTSTITINAPVDLGSIGSSFLTFPQNQSSARLILAGPVTGGSITLGVNSTFSSPANSFNGSTIVRDRVTLTGPGALTSTSGIHVLGSQDASAILILDNFATNVANRIPDAAPITLSRGSIQLVGSPTAGISVSETLGAVSAISGFNTIAVAPQGAVSSPLALTIASLSRSPGAAIDFQAGYAPYGKLGGSNPSDPHLYVANQSVTPLMGGAYTVNGNDFAKYTPAGVAPLEGADLDGGPETAWTPASIAAIPGNVTLTADRQIQALQLDYHSTSIATLNLGNHTLNLSAGGLLGTLLVTGTPGNHLTAGGASPTAELSIYTNPSFNLTLSANITDNPGPDGLYDSTPGGPLDADNGSVSVIYNTKLTLTGNNTYTGTTYVLGNTLTIANAAAVPHGALVVSAGTYQVNVDVPISTGPVTLLSGNIYTNGAATLNAQSYNVVSGSVFLPLVGSGPLTKTGDGSAQLASLSAYTGPITVQGGTLNFPISAGDDFTNSLNLQAGTVIVSPTGNGVARWTGPISLGDDTVFQLHSGMLDFAPTALTLGTNVGVIVDTGAVLNTSGLGTALSPSFRAAADGGGSLQPAILAPDGLIAKSLTVNGDLQLKPDSITTVEQLSGTGTISNQQAGTTSIITVTGTSTFGGILASSSGALALNKSSSGVLTLARDNSYTGGTTLDGGMLLVSNTTGSATGTGAVTLNGGTLAGQGIITGPVVAGSGAHTIAPSATLSATTTGILTLGALTTNSNTTLAFHLLTPGSSDTIRITNAGGLALNGGNIEVVTNSTTDADLGFFRIVQYAGGLNGSADSIALPAAEGAIVYGLDLARDPGYVDLHRGFLGDANDDGTVNFADFVQLSNHYGQSNQGWLGADFNNDGTTNFADFVVLSNHYGESLGGSSYTATADELSQMNAFASGATPTPEPVTLSILGMGALALLARRRRR